MRFLLNPPESTWKRRFALFPTLMTDGNTVIWLGWFEERWGTKYESAGSRFWLRRPTGSTQEYPVTLIPPRMSSAVVPPKISKGTTKITTRP